MTLKYTFFTLLFFILSLTYILKTLLYAVNNFMCKNPTTGKKGAQGLFFIAFTNKAGLLIIGHPVL